MIDDWHGFCYTSVTHPLHRSRSAFSINQSYCNRAVKTDRKHCLPSKRDDVKIKNKKPLSSRESVKAYHVVLQLKIKIKLQTLAAALLM